MWILICFIPRNQTQTFVAYLFFFFFLQEYEKELALLDEAYYSDVNDHDAFKQENLHFMSDMLLGFGIIKSTVLQTRANFNDIGVGDRKNTFLFRFKWL